jgi:hypothetical protein
VAFVEATFQELTGKTDGGWGFMLFILILCSMRHFFIGSSFSITKVDLVFSIYVILGIQYGSSFDSTPVVGCT